MSDQSTTRSPSVVVTPQEHRVLLLLKHGWTIAQLAAALALQPATVESYLRSLYRKTGLSRREALLWWWESVARDDPTGPMRTPRNLRFITRSRPSPCEACGEDHKAQQPTAELRSNKTRMGDAKSVDDTRNGNAHVTASTGTPRNLICQSSGSRIS